MSRQNTALIVALSLLVAGCNRPSTPPPQGESPQRIVSLAPNITETLYVLGLGDQVIGTTTFCSYPEEAKATPKVGGFGQYNYEVIVGLSPDLVILHKEYVAEKSKLNNLAIPTLETGSYSIADILATILSVGSACGASQQAESLVCSLEQRINELRRIETEQPRVLMIFEGNVDSMNEQLHAFGTNNLHSELLEIAGGRNVITSQQPYCLLSREAVLRLNPDIIIVLAPELECSGPLANTFSTYPTITAVQKQQIHILTNDYACIPGPRFIQTLEDFVRIIEKNHLEEE
ncbi:MAG TPA: helical backbone metal receptor [Pontiella sp.]